MSHTQNPATPPSSTKTANADAYAYAQRYGHRLIEVRIERADMDNEDSKTCRALIKAPLARRFSDELKDQLGRLECEGEYYARKLIWFVCRSLESRVKLMVGCG